MEPLSPEVAERIERLLGAGVRSAERVRRGYTNAERWLIRLSDSRSAFIKVGRSEHSREAIRKEAVNLTKLRAPFAPSVMAWEDGDEPILALEDLSDAHWPPPWTPDLVDRMLMTLDVVARHPVPEGTPALSRWRDYLLAWKKIAEDPQYFLSLGIATERWLSDALPVLCDTEAAAVLDGEDLCHFDVRSDNMCLTVDRAVLVDWNGMSYGRGLFDIAAWAPSLHFEGGPAPEDIVGEQPEYAAMISGYFAWAAGRPMEDWPGFERIRRVQREQLSTALPWAIRALDLPAPDGPVALRGIAPLS